MLLASLSNLGFLAIDGDLCDDEAMRQIGRLPGLRMLLAQEPAAGDAGFEALSASATLEYALMPMDVPDDGFRHVGRCERLEELWCMYGADTGDAATDHVSALRLKTYYAGATKITDRSLWILSRMDWLERVELQYCQGVTDAGLRALARLPRLQRLVVEGCRNVTRLGMSGFAPGVRVHYASI